MKTSNEDKPEKKPKLLQTVLSFSAFSEDASRSNTSLYFSKPSWQPPFESNNMLGSPQSANLNPERRANLANKPSDPLSPLPRDPTRSELLAIVAAETKSILPTLLDTLPEAKPHGFLYGKDDLHPLHQNRCPEFPASAIRVVNADTLDTVISFPPSLNDKKPVLILNMANAEHAGGGWLMGALAQEESICYRSSLSFTLKRKFYPLEVTDAVYSPKVVVLRDSLVNGHSLLDLSRPQALPIVSVVSVAAVRDPAIVIGSNGKERYKYVKDEDLMDYKLRMILRVAAKDGHRRLVLGALGCGAFGNPREKVASLWKSVLLEPEFRGWWESVMFAVMEEGGSKDGDGNYGVFFRKLDGLMV